MASILIVGCESRTAGWVPALRKAGHGVEQCCDALEFQDRFAGDAPDIVVVEIDNADNGEAMLMFQAHWVWPGCRVIAVSRDRSYRDSAIFGMGLWQPDRLLVQPPDLDVLLTSVDQLHREAVADRRLAVVRKVTSRPIGVPGDVILRCDDPVQARWSLRSV